MLLNCCESSVVGVYMTNYQDAVQFLILLNCWESVSPWWVYMSDKTRCFL